METAALPEDLATCYGVIRELAASLGDARRQVEQLGHRLDLPLRRMFGPRSERVGPGQLLLFAEEAEAPLAPSPEAPTVASPPSRARPVKGHGRRPSPADLPRERRVHEVPPDQRACPGCGHDRAPIGLGSGEQLDYRPASLLVKEQARYLHCRVLLTLGRRAS